MKKLTKLLTLSGIAAPIIVVPAITSCSCSIKQEVMPTSIDVEGGKLLVHASAYKAGSIEIPFKATSQPAAASNEVNWIVEGDFPSLHINDEGELGWDGSPEHTVFKVVLKATTKVKGSVVYGESKLISIFIDLKEAPISIDVSEGQLYEKGEINVPGSMVVPFKATALPVEACQEVTWSFRELYLTQFHINDKGIISWDAISSITDITFYVVATTKVENSHVCGQSEKVTISIKEKEAPPKSIKINYYGEYNIYISDIKEKVLKYAFMATVLPLTVSQKIEWELQTTLNFPFHIYENGKIWWEDNVPHGIYTFTVKAYSFDRSISVESKELTINI